MQVKPKRGPANILMETCVNAIYGIKSKISVQLVLVDMDSTGLGSR